MNSPPPPGLSSSIGTRGAVALLTLVISAPLAAQSLDEEYSRYLGAACAQMHFSRDASADLLPGQAGPRLTAFCSGPAVVAGTLSTSASGGGAGAAENAADDMALTRRRRGQGDAPSADAAQEIDATVLETLGVFLSLDYQRDKRDTTHYEAGRRSDSVATTLGADYRIGTRGVIGMAARFEKTDGDFDTGGDFRVSGHGISLYGSWFPTDQLFVDFGLGANDRNDDSSRDVSFTRTITFRDGTSSSLLVIPVARASSSRDSREFGAQIAVGGDYSVGALTLGPRVSLVSLHTTADAYVETGDTPMTLAFDRQTRDSLRSSVGAQASRAFSHEAGVVVAQFNMDWQHEFKDDQHISTARFSEDLRPSATRLRFLNDAPDRNTFTARLSLVAVFAHEVSAFVAADAMYGHSYERRYGASLGVRKAF